MTHEAAMEKILETATIEFFKANNLDFQGPLEKKEPIANSEGVVASLGFAGEGIKGILAITANLSTLYDSHPSKALGMDIQTSDSFDWAGEISNQIVGNIKREVGAFGLKFQLSTPSVVAGSGVAYYGNTKHHVCLNFIILGQRIELKLNFDMDASIDLNNPKREPIKQLTQDDSGLF